MTARVVLGLLVAAAAALAPAPAEAATATLVYEEPIPGVEPDPAYALTIAAAAGEANALVVEQDGSGYTVRDPGAGITAGAGCEEVARDTARCATTEPVATHSVFVDARDGDDRVRASSLPPGTSIQVRGCAGADAIAAGAGSDLLFGGRGADTLDGGAGNDRLDGGRGHDGLDGGTGSDRVLYESRRKGVRVDLAAGTGGAPGERDTLRRIEQILGGRGSDRLAGDNLANVIIGGAGDGRDRIWGRGGSDDLSGHRVSGGRGDDSVSGRRVACGPGRDLVSRGPGRWLRGPFPRGCETVLAIFVTLRPDPVERSRRHVEFALACRASRCRGGLELSDRLGVLGRARFALEQGEDPGAMQRVRVRLRRIPAGRVARLELTGERAYQRDWFRTRLR